MPPLITDDASLDNGRRKCHEEEEKEEEKEEGVVYEGWGEDAV